MKILLLALLPTIASANSSPTPFPVFLKAGFSSVIEFEDMPTRVVLGDGQNFKVEKLDHSLVIKTLSPYATTNLFVYFREQDPRLFVLTASEEAEPTFYKRFETVKPKPSSTGSLSSRPAKGIRRCRVTSTDFNAQKDYLIVNVEISADSMNPVQPNWNLVRLKYGRNVITPTKLWSERKEAQRDSKIRARFIFAKPNIPRNLKDALIVVPVVNGGTAFSVSLAKGKS